MRKKRRQKKSKFLLISICLIVAVAVYMSSYINRLERRVRDLKAKNDALRKTIERLRADNKKLRLIDDCRMIEKKVEQIRGLQAKESIEYEVIEKKSLRAMLDEKFAEAYPNSVFDSMETAYKILGFIEPDINLKSTLMNVYDEQVAAFYDYDNKKLYTVDNNMFTTSIRNMFLSHELTHMLQDQHYGLIKMGIDDTTNDDRALALSSLLEGDATRCMNTFYLQNASLHIFLDVVAGVYMELKQSEIDKAPAFLKESLMFPYMKGLIFVIALYETQDQTAIQNAFLNPPVSTEQIMHPEKYFITRDDPVIPQLPDLKDFYDANGLVELYRNTMGEFAMGVWLKNYVSATQARDASEGWDGDRYAVFQHPDNPDIYGYVLLTNWDTPQDAVAFVDAYQALLEKKYLVEVGAPPKSIAMQYDLPNDCRVSIRHTDAGVTVVCASGDIFDDVLRSLNLR